MKKYTASELVRRALNLADLRNTDFLTHDEHTQYLNDCWKQLFNIIINKGDLQFTSTVHLGNGGRFKLPDDLYQIAVIRDRKSGIVIPRRALSEAESTNGYEIVNDEIRIGNVTGCDLEMIYYVVPITITFPDKTIQTVDISSYGDLISIYRNRALVSNKTESYIIDLITGDIVSEISDVFENAQLTENRIVRLDETGSAVYNYKGELLDTVEDTYVPIPSNSNFNLLNGTGVYNIETGQVIECEDPVAVWSVNDNNYVLLYKAGKIEILLDNEIIWEYEIEIDAANSTDAGFQLDVSGSAYYITIDGSDIRLYQSNNPYWRWSCAYGYLPSPQNRLVNRVVSSLLDTEFNFPSELYMSIIAADLAMRYAMKQNAAIEGLKALYDGMMNTFMNSLSQSGDYTRIKSIY